jgi:hypothetical protein
MIVIASYNRLLYFNNKSLISSVVAKPRSVLPLTFHRLVKTFRKREKGLSF